VLHFGHKKDKLLEKYNFIIFMYHLNFVFSLAQNTTYFLPNLRKNMQSQLYIFETSKHYFNLFQKPSTLAPLCCKSAGNFPLSNVDEERRLQQAGGWKGNATDTTNETKRPTRAGAHTFSCAKR
jgi:hypothetical protein